LSEKLTAYTIGPLDRYRTICLSQVRCRQIRWCVTVIT